MFFVRNETMCAKVLLIDDSPLITNMLKSVLQSKGMEVTTAANGVEGLLALYSSMPHVVFLDIMLPDISGYMLSRIIKEDPRTRKIPVVLITGKEERSSKFWGIEAGADFYMSKEHCKPKNILSTLDRILQKFALPEKETTVQTLGTPEILSHVCNLLLPRLEELTIFHNFTKLYQLRDHQLVLSSLFDLLSYFIDFTSGLFFLPQTNIVYQYTNLPIDASFFHTMQKYMCRDVNQAAPAAVVLDSFYHLKQCPVFQEQQQYGADTIIESKAAIGKGMPLVPQELKSFFYYPIYCGDKKVAVLMLGSAQENLLEAKTVSLVDSITDLLKPIVTFIYSLSHTTELSANE